MSSFDFNTHELDFEDKLAKFEQNFSQCDRGRWLYINRSNRNRRHRARAKPTRINAADLEPELRVLWQELLNHIPAVQATRTSAHSDDPEFSGQFFRSDISKEVLKTEIRTTLSQLRNSQTATCDDMNDLSSSQKATVRSLKRVLSERTEQLEALKRKNRQVDNQKHRLEETVQSLTTSVTTCKRTHSPLANEVRALREQDSLLQNKLSDYEEGAKRVGAERKRFQSTIARYREELQLANHHTETAELELEQAKQRCEELEKRARETKASSSAVSARVKELQDVQDAMLKVMQDAKDNTDPGTVQRTLQDLGERRSRLVGRIANLLTKSRHSGTQNSAPTATDGAPVPSSGKLTNTDNTASNPALLAAEPSTGFNNSGSSSDTHDAANEPEASNRKPFLEGIRKFGNEVTRVATNRTRNESARTASPRIQRKSILDNVEKSRVAIENDVALREVIEMKEKELERMEDALYTAKEKAAALERSLQKERHKRRLENRTINTSPGEQISVEASSVVLTHRKSLFDWQSNDAAKRTSSDTQYSGDKPLAETDNSLETHDDLGIKKADN